MTTGELIEYGKPIVIANETDMENMTASNGIDGGNRVGIEYPDPVDLKNPVNTINHFKSFAREYLANNPDQSQLKKFLEDLDENEPILLLYDTLGFVNELIDLGNQYIKLRDSIYFTSFLASLAKRIRKYAQHFSETVENKNILRWLYTEVLESFNKLNDMNNNGRKTTVINLPEYLGETQKNIIKFCALENEMKINEHQREYQNFLDSQFERAIKTVKTEILPKMENIFIEINSQVLQLIGELVERQDKYIEDTPDPDVLDALSREDEDEDEEDVDLSRSPNLVFPLKVEPTANAFVTFATSENGKSSIKNIPNDLDVPSPKEHIQGSTFKYKKAFENEYNLLLEQLSELENELEKMSGNDFPFDLSKIQRKILQSKFILVEKVQSNKMKNATIIEQIRKDLKTYFKHENIILEPTHRLSTLFEFENSPLFFHKPFSVKDIKRDGSMISSYGSVNDTSEWKRVNKEYYFKYVYNQIIWRLEEMDAVVGDIKRNLNNHSYIELDIIKWRAQNTTRDIKAFFRKIGNETSVKENLYRSIEKLEDIIVVLVGFYNQIDLISIAKSNVFAGAIIGKSQYSSNYLLNDAVLALKYIIQRYSILEQYEIAMNAFKQYRFPFANILMSRFELPLDLEAEDIQTIARVAVDHINYLKEKIALQDSTIGKYDYLMSQNVEFSSSETSFVGPFYAWTYADNGDNINKLLRGEEIELEANINEGPDLSAIKFNEIGIYLKSANPSKQENLYYALQDFTVNMVMVGKTHYKCNEKIYRFAGDENIVINYSFKRSPDGKPIMTNKVYQKLYQMDYFLSPYTTWKLKITNNKNNFDKLKSFGKDDIEALELLGVGQYIHHELLPTDVCD